MSRISSIAICVNDRLSRSRPSCAMGGAEKIAVAFESEIARRGLEIAVERLHCLGECAKGPNLRLSPGGRFFSQVRIEDVPAILDEAQQDAGQD